MTFQKQHQRRRTIEVVMGSNLLQAHKGKDRLAAAAELEELLLLDDHDPVKEAENDSGCSNPKARKLLFLEILQSLEDAIASSESIPEDSSSSSSFPNPSSNTESSCAYTSVSASEGDTEEHWASNYELLQPSFPDAVLNDAAFIDAEIRQMRLQQAELQLDPNWCSIDHTCLSMRGTREHFSRPTYRKHGIVS